MNRNFFNPSRKDSLIVALMYLLVGLVFCFFSGGVLTAAVRFIGILLMLFGAYELYIYFGLHRSENTLPLLIGVPAVIFGLILAFWPNWLISFFPIIAGIFLIFNSVIQIQKALVLRSGGFSNWIMVLVLALIMLIFGIVLIMKPMMIINTLVRLTGIALIIEAIIIGGEAFISTRK